MKYVLVNAVAILTIATATLSCSPAFAAPGESQGNKTLEQDYANLCANRPSPESETCAALKRALLEKLSGGPSSAPAAAASTIPAAPNLPPADQLRNRWGFLIESVGKTYFTSTPGLASGVAVYSWKVPGEWLVITSQSATKTGEIQVDPDSPATYSHLRFNQRTGKLETWMEGPQYLPTRLEVSVQTDSSIIVNNPDGKHRNRSWRNADGSLTRVTEELKRNGTWKPMAYGTLTSREMTPQLLAQLRGSSGDSGLMGALAMATGAALAGGNAEQVVGMAMKGAELTTDNEMSRNVLAGQGDAMITAGTQRMAAQDASAGVLTAPTANVQAGKPGGPSSPVTSPAGVRIASAGEGAMGGANPRVRMSSWCWAADSARTVYMSAVGSRDVTADESEAWRSAMEREFKQQISGDYSALQCDIDDDGDFSYTRSHALDDKPVQIPWAPH
jgi:hypothetical protein